MSDVVIHQQLDTSGLVCPLPVLKAAKALRAMGGGQVLAMTATDPKTQQDVPLFCQEQGYKLLRQERDGDKWLFTIEK